MYVLRFLEKAPNDNIEPPEAVHVEHRLACSGELYTVITEMQGQQLIDNDPPPVGVDPGALAESLKKLAFPCASKCWVGPERPVCRAARTSPDQE
jgi:hypothetical protein